MRQPETGIRKRIPIRRRFLTTVLLTTLLSVLAASVTGFFCIRWVRGATERTLSAQLEYNLKNIIEEKAASVDARLEHYEKYIEFIVDSVASMYDDEDAMLSAGRVFGPPTDTHDFELTRAFASEDLTAEDLERKLRFYSNLEKLWGPIARENEDLISTIYLGTNNGLLVSYDRYSYLSVPPEGEELVYNYYVTEWYKRGIQDDGIFYTGVYMDFQGRGLTVTIGSGIRNAAGEKVGVTCMDFNLSALYDGLFNTDLQDGTFTFVLDHNNTIISPDSDMIDLRDFTGLTLDELDDLIVAPDGILQKNDNIYVCVPLERVGWTLCACVPIESIQSGIHEEDQSIQNAVFTFICIALFIFVIAAILVNQSVQSITQPLEMLGRDIKIISDGDLTYRAAVYRNDEIGDITSGMNEMVDRLNFTLNELMSSQEEADAMSRLATQDALTGVRNKTAFDRQSKLLAEELAGGAKEFGFAMLDLNNLKLINDNYGHEKGDIAIRNLCRIICDVFNHSPVFRVGGDEFVVLLKNEDYQNIDALVKRFGERIAASSGNKAAEPWNRVSAAIGCAKYDETLDSDIESVLDRADQEMYICKKRMKGLRA